MKLSSMLMTTGLLYASAVIASPVLTIVPSLTSTTVRSDSQTVVSYSVTNNTNQTINNISITPNYHTTGQPSGITLSGANTCSTLTPNGTCNFDVLIQGANQPASFQVTPEVCGYSNAFCSTPSNTNYLYITMDTVGTAYAYFAVVSGNNANKLVPVNAKTLQIGTPVSSAFANDNSWGQGVAVSSDGTRVYVGARGTPAIMIFSGGPNPVLIKSIPLTYSPYLNAVAVSPNGKVIYATQLGTTLYRVDNNGGVYTLSSLDISPATATGLAISPDSRTAYLTDYWADSNKGRFYVMNISDNKITQTLTNDSTTCGFDGPMSTVASPDGKTIYVGNQGSVVSVIQNNHGTYSCATPISIGEQTQEMAMSPNGQYLYVGGVNAKIYVINTATGAKQTFNIPTGSWGLAADPDGSKLFMSNNADNKAYIFNLVNGIPTGALIQIDVGGQQQSQNDFAG